MTRSSAEGTFREICTVAQIPSWSPSPEMRGGHVIRQSPPGSVVIPEHDEAPAIQRCVDALFTGCRQGELDVVVVCNGCSDATAALARSSGHPVRVIELGKASKPAALRTGDAAVSAFPRLYLDADVSLPGSAARLGLERLG